MAEQTNPRQLPVIKLWKDKNAGLIEPDLFSKTAEKWAQCLSDQSQPENKGRNKRSQIRKFYDEVLRLRQLSRDNSDEWENILPLVKMLAAKAAYSLGRKHVSEAFCKKMIGETVESIKDRKDLELFANFFEAFMCYYRQYGSE